MAQQKKTDIVPADKYAITTADQGDLMEILELNLGNKGLDRFDLDRIKVPAGGGTTWEIPTLEGVDETKAYEGIIVHWTEPRAYWHIGFDESGGGTPPDCSSHDGVIGNGDFGPGSEENPTGHCDRCPMSDWGSAPGDRRGQACKQMRVLFTVRPDSMLPDAVICPPTSIKPMRQYFLRLASRSVPFYSVITRLELERTRSGDGIQYSRITPSLGARLEPEQVEQIRPYAQAIKQAMSGVMIDVSADDLTGGVTDES